MRDEYAIPPLRDVPGDRLAERKRHLVAEIAHPSARRRVPPRSVLVLVAAFVVVVVGTATAFGTARNLLSGPHVNSKIAYIHKTTGRYRDGRSELWVMNADGSGERMLARGGQPGATLGAPAWSPDGRRIAFVDAYSAVYVMNADGSGRRKLTQGGELSSDLRWSPDGRKILLACFKCAAGPGSRFSGWGEVYVMNADGSALRNLTRDPRTEGRAEWSPDGRKIAFGRAEPGRSEIVVMNADGSAKRTLAEGFGPVWSPDGRKLAFTKALVQNGRLARRTVRVHEIYVMDADGSEQRRLTRNRVSDDNPQWGPDGRRIAFLRGVRRGGAWKTDLYVMNADGSEQRNLGGRPVPWLGYGWSPDGRLIAFTRGRGYELAVVNADGSELRDLTHSRTGNFFGAWSPGRRRG